MARTYTVAVVGAGAVGIEMLRCLHQRRFPARTITVLARSARTMEVDGRQYPVSAVSADSFTGVQIALFAGTEGEKGAAVTYAQEAVRRGAVVIDNGADFRMDDAVPLVVPEVNADDIKAHRGIIANPNCTTIQMLVAVAPLYRAFGVRRIILSSYQAASGAGKAAVDELMAQTRSIGSGEVPRVSVFPKQLALNVIPQIGGFAEDGFTSEEWKVVRETHKMLHDASIRISATCVRVPVAVAHSESVYIETAQPVSAEEVRAVLSRSAGVSVIDDTARGGFPVPLEAGGTDDVFVGRIRRDPSVPNGIWLWVVADNLRKGAALNAVQIAERLVSFGMLD